MSWNPVAFIAPNYSDYATWWLKAYEQGTTTAKSMALDDAGAVTVAKLQLDADGFINTAGGAIVIPYIEESYDLWLFPTEADADANTTTDAIQLADDITAASGGGSSGTETYVADMIALSPVAGATYETTGYVEGFKGGMGSYLCKTAAQASTDGDSIDELINLTAANGNVWILQQDGEVDFRACGARIYDAGDPYDNAAVLLAADAQNFTVRVEGVFFFLTAVDLGLGSTNIRTQILGIENTNVDGDTVNGRSSFLFDGTAGITVNAGAKIHDIEFENIGTKAGSGTGLVANNVHSASLNNITCTGFERGFYIFAYQSNINMLYSYECTTGLEFYGECTSLTVQSCWARRGTTGFIVGPSVTYSTFLNCAVDDCFVPYSVAGDNVVFDNCGAEIDLTYYNSTISPSPAETEIEGYIRWNSSSGGASTVSIVGGRYLMTGSETAETGVYSVAGANNESSYAIISRMSSNSFQDISTAFTKGKLRVVIDDNCAFSDVFKLSVKEGEFGSLMMDGRSSGTLRRYSKGTPKIGSTQNDANSIPNMLAITIEEIVDFDQAITDGDAVFIKFAGNNSDSYLQADITVFPMEKSGTLYQPQRAIACGTGGGNGIVRNSVMNTIGTPNTPIDGTIMEYVGNDALGLRQNYYFKRPAIQCKCLVRIEATGWCDENYRDSLITLVVGPDDA